MDLPIPDRWHEFEVRGIFSEIVEVVVWRRRSVWGRLPRHVVSLMLIRVYVDSCRMFLCHRNELRVAMRLAGGYSLLTVPYDG